MGVKIKMITNEPRREGNEKVDRQKRYVQILSALQDQEMTAREIAQNLHFSDLNAVKPRLTELRYNGKIEAVGGRKDPITGVSVTIYRRVKNA